MTYQFYKTLYVLIFLLNYLPSILLILKATKSIISNKTTKLTTIESIETTKTKVKVSTSTTNTYTTTNKLSCPYGQTSDGVHCMR